LTVTVIQAQQLPAMDLGGRCDSYVKVRLLPAKKPTHNTEVLYNTCNPLFQETFAFEVALRIRFRDEILRWTASRKRGAIKRTRHYEVFECRAHLLFRRLGCSYKVGLSWCTEAEHMSEA